MLQTDIQTYRQTHTYRASDEAGPRGAFAPKNHNKHIEDNVYFWIMSNYEMVRKLN